MNKKIIRKEIPINVENLMDFFNSSGTKFSHIIDELNEIKERFPEYLDIVITRTPYYSGLSCCGERYETDEEFEKRIEASKKRSEASKKAAEARKEAKKQKEKELLEKLKAKYENER